MFLKKSSVFGNNSTRYCTPNPRMAIDGIQSKRMLFSAGEGQVGWGRGGA